MEINVMALITVAVLILLSILPVWIINKKRKNKEKKNLQLLLNLAEKNQCRISEHQLFNQIVIGLDREARKVFFIRTSPEHPAEQQIDLAPYKKCRMEETGRSGNNGHVIDKIGLLFIPAQTGQKEATLVLYDTDYDNLTLSGEIQFAEKWANLINDLLKQN